MNINLSWNQLPRHEVGSKQKEQAQIEETESEMVQYIIDLLKYNKKLIHADFSHCGITEFMFGKLQEVWRKFLSLSSIHLCGNPFIDKIEDINTVVKNIRAKPILPAPVHFEALHEVTKPADSREMLLLGDIQSKLEVQDFKFQVDDMFFKQFVVQRKIGLKKELPLAGQWEILRNKDSGHPDKKCFYCNKHQYCLIFWSESIQFEVT